VGNANIVNQLLQLKSLIARLQISLLEAVCVIKKIAQLVAILY